MKKWLKELFCKHKWEDKLEIQEFATLSGDRYEIVCAKCGKIKGSYFKRYNEDGTGYL